MATKHLRDIIVKMAYPPGSVYITTKNLTVANMESLFPSDTLTWQQLSGRMLRQAINTATTLEQTGGILNTQLITHTHAIQASSGAHVHAVKKTADRIPSKGSGYSYVWQSTLHTSTTWVNSGTGAHSHVLNSAGSAPSTGSNLPVYVVVKMFKRVKKTS